MSAKVPTVKAEAWAVTLEIKILPYFTYFSANFFYPITSSATQTSSWKAV